MEDEDALAEAYNRGLDLEKSGDHDGAAAAYREVLALDPADHGGAAVRLAALGRGEAPSKAPTAYVTTLFDQHAEAFDSILVDQLQYRVPWQLAELIGRLAPGPYERMLDLGCGTGLAGLTLKPHAAEITGVDLAESMLEQADEREVYDSLFVGDVVQFLEEEDTRFDLIVATDVLPYLGDLTAFMAGLKRCIAPGGIIGLSSEALPNGGQDWKIGPTQRYLHSEAYLRRVMDEAGLTPLAMDPITVRFEDGVAQPGNLILARA